ncbi:hypothetical protein NHG32_01400 [Aerococcaceae bacterium NML191219]|nr:hypothetical protein [Aerococcaceae bacterium NML191219]
MAEWRKAGVNMFMDKDNLFIIKRKFRTASGLLAILLVSTLTIGYVWSFGIVMCGSFVIGCIVATLELLVTPTIMFIKKNPMYLHANDAIKKWILLWGIFLFGTTLLLILSTLFKPELLLWIFATACIGTLYLFIRISYEGAKFILLHHEMFTGEYEVSNAEQTMFTSYYRNLLIVSLLSWICFTFALVLTVIDVILAVGFLCYFFVAYFSIWYELSEAKIIVGLIGFGSGYLWLLYQSIASQWYSRIDSFDIMLMSVVFLLVGSLFVVYQRIKFSYEEQARLIYKVDLNVRAHKKTID